MAEEKPLQKWAELLEDYLEYLHARNYAHSTLVGRRSELNQFFRYLVCNEIDSCTDISLEIILQYKADLVVSRKLASRTIDGRLYAIKSFLKYLKRTKQISENVLTLIEIPIQAQRLPRSILTQEEVFQLLEAPDVSSEKGIRDKAILETFYSTGLRLSELVNLDVGNVDTAEGFVNVRKGKNNVDAVIPIGKTACQWIRMYVRLARPVIIADLKNPALFVGILKGERIDKDVVYELVREYGKRAGIRRRVYPHILRHSMASHFIANGGSSRDCQALLRHKLLDTTQQYVRITENQLLEMHRKFHPRS